MSNTLRQPKEVLKKECSENFFDNIASLLLLKKSSDFFCRRMILCPLLLLSRQALVQFFKYIFYSLIDLFPPTPVVVRFFQIQDPSILTTGDVAIFFDKSNIATEFGGGRWRHHSYMPAYCLRPYCQFCPLRSVTAHYSNYPFSTFKTLASRTPFYVNAAVSSPFCPKVKEVFKFSRTWEILPI